ncbi:hypothetical protein HNQ60_003942 [Povalibacter uvarum]|uniref:Uncharacterized protein n=1 Tax=Povalibacter uvarum TaxID=732238 RepID=A0A841HST0_9GAMM|nr:hypothetical protein [Povalibacter uvarum]MBB6095052.1 hypothetical protein [Povalibacter uvarum]
MLELLPPPPLEPPEEPEEPPLDPDEPPEGIVDEGMLEEDC